MKSARIKYISLFIAAVMFSKSSSAALNGALESMFMSNSTPPSSINTADRGGYSFGGASIHIPVQQVNIISFDPPRFNAGCGGIDLYFGSFSFINAQQLVALFRQIVTNAAAALFYASINSISPDLANLMSKFQAVVGDINRLARNTCAMGSAGMQNANDAMSSLAQDSSTAVDAAKGMIPDWFSGEGSTTNQAATNIAKSDQSPSSPTIGSSPTATALTASSPSSSSSATNLNTGNFVWKMFDATNPEKSLVAAVGIQSSSPQQIRELLMSFSGTQIVVSGNTQISTSQTVNVNSNPTSNGGTNSGSTITTYTVPALLHFDNILNGTGALSKNSATPAIMVTCANLSANYCTTINETQVWDFAGAKTLVHKYLFGTPAATYTTDSVGLDEATGAPDGTYTAYNNGIIFKISHCDTSVPAGVKPASNIAPTCNLKPSELAFLQSVSSPLQSQIMHLQATGNANYGASNAYVFKPYEDVFAIEYAVKIAIAIRDAITIGVTGTAQNAAKFPKGVQNNLDQLNNEILANETKETSYIQEVNYVMLNIDAMLKNNGNAINVGF